MNKSLALEAFVQAAADAIIAAGKEKRGRPLAGRLQGGH